MATLFAENLSKTFLLEKMISYIFAAILKINSKCTEHIPAAN
jgi:hypothetical protein